MRSCDEAVIGISLRKNYRPHPSDWTFLPDTHSIRLNRLIWHYIITGILLLPLWLKCLCSSHISEYSNHPLLQCLFWFHDICIPRPTFRRSTRLRSLCFGHNLQNVYIHISIYLYIYFISSPLWNVSEKEEEPRVNTFCPLMQICLLVKTGDWVWLEIFEYLTKVTKKGPWEILEEKRVKFG